MLSSPSADSYISEATHPNLSGVERPFFDYWMANVVSRSDPHLQRWVDYEEGAVERARQRTSELEHYEPVVGRKVLEIGCQNGAWLLGLARDGAEVVGVDTATEAVGAAAVRAECYGVEVDARVGDACSLEFDPDTFDIVASSDVIEHVPDKEAMVREVMRVLKPGGLALIKAPQRFSLKHLRSDPHYQHAGVSVLPASLVTWYLTRFRGEPVYEVETLPTAHGIRRTFRRYGAVVVARDGQPERRAEGVFAGSTDFVRALIDELRQGFTIVVRKPPAPVADAPS